MTRCRRLGWAFASLFCLPQRLAAGPPQGQGSCLGDCGACFGLLDALPRELGAAAGTHLDVRRAGPEEIFSFLEAAEVCQAEELFPLSIDREFWSLAALTGGSARLTFPTGASAFRAATNACVAMRAVSVEAFAHALRSASECSAQFVAGLGVAPRVCGPQGIREVVESLAGAVLEKVSPNRQSAWQMGSETGFVAQLGNETRDILGEYAARVQASLSEAVRMADSLEGGKDVGVLDIPLTNSSAAFRGYQVLTSLAIDIARHNRLMMENVRLVWGIKQLAVELSAAYPTIESEFPPVSFHTNIYGRHFDVLENLLKRLQAEQRADMALMRTPLRMAEMGVACGPIGYHLLHRFADLQYTGADPTIRDVVRDAYKVFGPRASLHAITSQELHESLPPDQQFDFVFIDGPHTYANVRNDIAMWQPRIRRGGIIAGHDFTCAHPPLLWAVLEARMQGSGGEVNVGLDGVWWWRVE